MDYNAVTNTCCQISILGVGGIMTTVTANSNENIAKIIESMKVKENRTAKLVKPARVPA